MKNPKLELKKIKLFKGHDGTGLDCDLYVNGVKVAHVFDSAHGGGNEYHAYGPDYKANNKIIQDLEEYAKTLPHIMSSFDDKAYPQDLDSIINDLLMVIEKEKGAKKMAKKFEDHIIAGVPNGDTYREWAFGKGKNKVKLSTLPTAKLQDTIYIIKRQLTAGEQILNTNLEALGIRI